MASIRQASMQPSTVQSLQSKGQTPQSILFSTIRTATLSITLHVKQARPKACQPRLMLQRTANSQARLTSAQRITCGYLRNEPVAACNTQTALRTFRDRSLASLQNCANNIHSVITQRIE